MTTTTIQAPGAGGDGFSTTAGNDGTLTIAVGPTGAKVNAMVLDAAGNPTLLKAPINNAAPCFSASYAGTTTSTSGATTKVPYSIKDFDLTNAYDNTTNFRFQPLVAGYYQIIASCAFGGAGASAGISRLYLNKNGAQYKYQDMYFPTTSVPVNNLSDIVFLNGSTDYIEVTAFQNTGSTLSVGGSALLNKFQGVLLVRTA